MEKVRDACGEHAECTKLKNELELCNQRVSSRSNTEETCVQELFDFLECQDKCVSRFCCNLLKSATLLKVSDILAEKTSLKSCFVKIWCNFSQLPVFVLNS